MAGATNLLHTDAVTIPAFRPRRISPAARGKHIHTASSGEEGQTFPANPDSKRPN